MDRQPGDAVEIFAKPGPRNMARWCRGVVVSGPAPVGQVPVQLHQGNPRLRMVPDRRDLIRVDQSMVPTSATEQP